MELHAIDLGFLSTSLARTTIGNRPSQHARGKKEMKQDKKQRQKTSEQHQSLHEIYQRVDQPCYPRQLLMLKGSPAYPQIVWHERKSGGRRRRSSSKSINSMQ